MGWNKNEMHTPYSALRTLQNLPDISIFREFGIYVES